MDIRDIDGLWCDDITFCQEECGWKSCPRNKKNIRDKTIPHSFSVEIPEDCPKRQEGMKQMSNKETVINRMETICNICKENTWRTEFSSDTIYPLLRDAIAMLKEQQEIVRCISCTFYRSDGECALHNSRWKPEGFCSWAIRKEGR